MNPFLSAEQLAIQNAIRKFVRQECPRDIAHALAAQAAFPTDAWRKLLRLGFHSLTVPAAYGGGGPDLTSAAVVIAEIAAAAPVLAAAFASVALYGGQALSLLGSEEQEERLLPAIAAGDLSFTLALSEPPLASTPTTVTPTADGLILRGGKAFVGLADRADFIWTSAVDAEGEITLLLVPTSAAGVSWQATDMVGFHGAGVFAVDFAAVRVGADDIVGGPLEKATKVVTTSSGQIAVLVAIEHITQTALALGIAAGAYEYAADYARQRRQFDHALIDFEAIQHLLVDLAVEIEAVRLLLWRATALADAGGDYAGHDFALAAAMARLRAGDLARQAGLQAVQILGGYGYTVEYDAERALRDALTLLSGNETPALLRDDIGRLLALGAAERT